MSGRGETQGIGGDMKKNIDYSNLRKCLDKLYNRFNKQEYISPDPLEFVYKYDEVRDKEVVGMIASSLAFGNLKQILKNLDRVFTMMQPSPYLYVKNTTKEKMQEDFKDFKHRMATGNELARLIGNMKDIIEKYGSLYDCFMKGYSPKDETILNPLLTFAKHLKTSDADFVRILVPNPDKMSGFKKLNLFLRWFIRKDDVDLGLWKGISPSQLIMPVDIHIHNFGYYFGFTNRKQTDMKTALEITSVFRQINPEDPVKYDFSVTRGSMRKDFDLLAFLEENGISRW